MPRPHPETYGVVHFEWQRINQLSHSHSRLSALGSHDVLRTSTTVVNYEHLLAAATTAWDRLDKRTLKSVCACPWIERAIQA